MHAFGFIYNRIFQETVKPSVAPAAIEKTGASLALQTLGSLPEALLECLGSGWLCGQEPPLPHRPGRVVNGGPWHPKDSWQQPVWDPTRQREEKDQGLCTPSMPSGLVQQFQQLSKWAPALAKVSRTLLWRSSPTLAHPGNLQYRLIRYILEKINKPKVELYSYRFVLLYFEKSSPRQHLVVL